MIVHETRRLHMQAWELDDFDALAALARNPEVMRFIAEGKPWPDSRIGYFIGLQSAFQESLGYSHWKLSLKKTGEFVGFCGMAPLSSVGSPEIGWWLSPDFWGQGLAHEAAIKTIDVAFGQLGFSRLVARVYAQNSRSIRLLNQIGMSFEKSLLSNDVGDIHLYSGAPSTRRAF